LALRYQICLKKQGLELLAPAQVIFHLAKRSLSSDPQQKNHSAHLAQQSHNTQPLELPTVVPYRRDGAGMEKLLRPFVFGDIIFNGDCIYMRRANT